MIQKILLILILIGSLAYAADYQMDEDINMLGNEIYNGSMNWTVLQNYPSSCPAGSTLTQLDDTATCTDLREYECVVCQDNTCANNGSTDAIIQTCLDSIDDDGGSILIKKGVYNITSQMNGKKNTKLIGEGVATELVGYDASVESMLKFNGRHDDWLVLDSDSGNWSGASITISDEGTIKRFGAGSLKLIAGAGTTAYRDISSEDWSDYNGLNLWIYVNDHSYLFNVTVHEGANSDKFVMAGSSDGGDWNLHAINLDNPTYSTGTVNYAAIDNITITFEDANTYYIDDMRLTMNNIHISDMKFSFQPNILNGDGIAFEDVGFSSIDTVHFANIGDECIALYGVFYTDISNIYVTDASHTAYNPIIDMGHGDGDDHIYYITINRMYVTGTLPQSGSVLKGLYICGEYIDISNVFFTGGQVDNFVQISVCGSTDYVKSKYINVHDCVFSGAGTDGITVEAELSHINIYNNIFHNLNWRGIYLKGNNTNIKIMNNHFSNIQNNNMYIEPGYSDLRIFNNYGYDTDTLQNDIDMDGNKIDNADFTGTINSNGEFIAALWSFDAGTGSIAYGKYDNDGTINGNPVWVKGKFGYALEFDGTDDEINVGNDTSIDGSTFGESVSFEVWFKNNESAQNVIMSNWESYQFEIESNKFRFGIWTSDGNDFNTDNIVSDSAVNDDDWHHFVGVYNGIDIRMYIDGVLQADINSVTGTVDNDTADIIIAASDWGTNRFIGTLDELMVHNRSLTYEEVRSSFISGLASHSYDGHCLSKAGGTIESITISTALTLTPTASPPASPVEGDMYSDTSHALCWYNSTAWLVVAGSGSCS